MKEIVSKLPTTFGIYLMKDETGKVIYVGKAINIKKRVSQYFNNTPKSMRIYSLVSQIRAIDYVITKSETEALALECNYIKNFSPKYNVLLKDDKSYPYIKVTVKDEYPTIYLTRKKLNDGNKYFGPYTNVHSAKEVHQMIKEIFPIKRCTGNPKKRCLYYYINRCLGICEGNVDKDEYTSMINQIILFLEGKTKDIQNNIKKEIEKESLKLNFEKANILKNRLIAISNINDKQQVDNLDENKTDVVSYVQSEDKIYIQIFKIRFGKVIMHDSFEIDILENIEDDVVSYLAQYYLNVDDKPKKIYLKLSDDNTTLINNLLTDISVLCPKRGSKLKLVKMVENNINIKLLNSKKDYFKDLKQIINMDIESIECYDISNLFNEYIVGCMIRVDSGKLNKNMYRKFKIKSTSTANDFLSMKEVILRRLKHEDWTYPDAIFVDGGKTQITAALEAITELKIENIKVFGMVKDDKHRTRALMDSNFNEIDISKVIKFVTFMQDEIHRFAITYHKLLRDKGVYGK